MRTLNRLFITAVAGAALVLAGCNSDNPESEAAEHIERSQVYADQGQYRSAMIELRNAIQKDPGSVEPVVELANVMIIVGAARQASDLLEPWLDSNQDAVALLLARAYMQQGKHVSAREALEGFSPSSDDERANYTSLMADFERLTGNFSGALEGYEQALTHSPGHAPAITGMARSYMDQGQFNDALSRIDAWLREFGNEPNVLYLKGLVHYQLNELDSAVTALTDGTGAVRDSDMFLPERRQILSLLTRTLTEQGNMTQAMVYNNILSENTDTELTQSAEAAMDALRAGDLETARATLEDLIQRNPDSQLAALLLGAVSLQQGDLEEGTPLLTDNIDAEVTPVPFIRMATMAQIDQGKRNEALATLERALLARPTDADLLAMHGVLALADPQKASEGVVSLTKALQIDPSRGRLRLALSQYHVDQEQPEQALGHLRSAFEQSPQDWPVTDFYLSLLLQEGHTAEAQELRNSLAENFPEDPNANMLIALTDYRTGNRSDAIARLRQQDSDASNYAMSQVALGRMLATEGQNQEAIRAYLNAAEADPTRINALQEAGRIYARTNDTEAVIIWLQQVSEQRPELLDNALALAAQVKMQMGELDEAEADLDQLNQTNVFVNGVKAELLATRARQAAQRQDWTSARSYVAEAISLQPRNLDLQLLLVRIAAAEGQITEARSMLDDLEAEFGRDTAIILVRSIVVRADDGIEASYRYLKGQWEQSNDVGLLPETVALARQVAPSEIGALVNSWSVLQPENPAAWQSRGDWDLNRGNDAEAISHYREALRLQPNNVLAMNNLAWLLRDSNPTEAVDLARQAAEGAPNSAAVLDTYGWVLFKAGRNQDAVNVLQQALELEPDNTEIEQHLREVQAAM